MIEKIARWVAIGGAFAVLLIPLFVTDSMYFPFITGKNFAFRIIVEVMLVAWAVLALVSIECRPKRSWIFLAMAVFTIIVGLADMTGINPLRSFWSNYERMEGFIAILHLAGYLFVLGSVLKTEKLWNTLFNSSVIVSVALSFIAFSEMANVAPGADARIDATLGNPTYFAVYLLFNIFITLLLAYRHRAEKFIVGLYGLAGIAQVIALYNTGTRGTLLGLLGGLGLSALIIFVRGSSYPRLRRLAGGTVALIIIATGAFFIFRNASFVAESPVLSRIANISLTDTTVESRITLWTSIAWEGFKERPLLGWGQDNFIVVFGKYYDPIMYKQEPWFDRAHNVFIDWLIAGGLLGLLSYLLLFGAGIVMLWKSTFSLPEKALFTGLFAAYAFHNIFVFDNLISYIYFAMILAYIHAHRTYIEQPQMHIINDTAPTIRPSVVMFGGVVVACALIYFLNVPYIARSQTLIHALKEDYGGRYDSALLFYDETLALSGLGREESREQLVQTSIRVWKSNAADSIKEAFTSRARAELEASVAADPLNTRPLFFLGYALSNTGADEEGIDVFRSALTVNPARQNFLYEIARTYLNAGEFDAAIATFKEAYDILPENDEALTYYAAALISSGRIVEGERMLTERFGTTAIDNSILLSAYKEQGATMKVAAILEQRLAQMSPQDDFQTRLSLAVIYINTNNADDRPKAIEHLERAIFLNDQFKTQGQQMIEALKAGKSVIVK